MEQEKVLHLDLRLSEGPQKYGASPDSSKARPPPLSKLASLSRNSERHGFDGRHLLTRCTAIKRTIELFAFRCVWIAALLIYGILSARMGRPLHPDRLLHRDSAERLNSAEELADYAGPYFQGKISECRTQLSAIDKVLR